MKYTYLDIYRFKDSFDDFFIHNIPSRYLDNFPNYHVHIETFKEVDCTKVRLMKHYQDITLIGVFETSIHHPKHLLDYTGKFTIQFDELNIKSELTDVLSEKQEASK